MVDATGYRGLAANFAHSYDSFVMAEVVRAAHLKKSNFLDLLASKARMLEGTNKASQPVNDKAEKLIEIGNRLGCYSYEILYHVNKSNIRNLPRDILLNLINELPEKTYSLFYSGSS
ncbi:hypothetical protein TAO_0984 [Candidatus Nitrosoglobus terrae]|uniref:Uncharacterized protein n=1 Tax=Candidatus Nitrosoglobus terrae TaxID=1630141 RepID=A0A1Q2SMJ8_9GAMM|nr:hypothetical protein [Candidatus Nitrosoglobus terrae]BAW80354.1 hypothetical protein TAO_0984 [Candidatus Nitrosoglobus terrae]